MKASIIGYGKSGKVAYNLLKLKGINDIDIFDNNSDLNLKKISEYKDIYDFTVVSPGIDLKVNNNITGNIISEIELAFEHVRNRKIIGITGTNGKSTTTHITAEILNNMGIKAIACGNIGLPFGEAVLDESIEVFVVELSSFQIELLNNFKLQSGCIINITQDHLDRYGNIENYEKAKLLISNFIENNGTYVTGSKILNTNLNSSIKHIEIDENLSKYPKLVDNKLDFKDFFVDLSKFNLFGRHNIINLSFALSLINGIYKLDGDVTKYILNLTSMAHRTELIGKYNGVTWINDSKATNVDSVLTAIKSVEKPSYLLLGGRDKKSDYRVLKDLINKNITNVIYFGEARNIISNQLSPLIDANEETFTTLADAVKYCCLNAEKGSTVILSPACTSFDEFKSYEDRGEKFALYVKNILGIDHDKF